MASAEEVRAIEEAHRAAQARLGIAGAYLALKDWNTVSATAAADTSAAWLSRSLRMINAIRRKSRRLAIAYYQLARALETGYTLGLPEYSDDPEQVTMSGLRKQYLDLLLQVATIDREPSGASDKDERFLEGQLRDAPPAGGNNPRAIRFENTAIDEYIQDLLDETGTEDSDVQVDEFEWDDDLTYEQIEAAFLDALKAESVDVQADKADRELRNDEQTPAQAVKKIEEEHELSGSRGAGKVDQFGIEAGRRAIIKGVRNDGRVKVVARGTGPNPCAFCAMLASRGFTYASEELRTTRRVTARGRVVQPSEFDSDGFRKYHPNCHCYPIIGWRKKELPPLNAFYKERWKTLIADEGYTGVDALNAWRRWIYRRRREEEAATAAA